tara:strand:+ start:1788 stop:2156 length:369 start_codon:yes stop_codon:yes gene_type:complete
MAEILDILSWIFLLIGGFLGITGAVGLFRFPDFFTRLHAASITDTLCAGMIVLGLILQAPDAMMVIKLLLILLILTYTSPTAAHALAKSAIHGGLKPLSGSTEPEAPSGHEESSQGEPPFTH